MARLLIRGACVLTLGQRSPNHPEADLLVDDGRIAEIGQGLRVRDAEAIDGTDAIVMPGFVDTHRHAVMSLLRNSGETAFVDTTTFTPDDVYAATLISLLGAVEAGITTVVDWAQLPADESHLEAALQAHADVGLRTVFVHRDPHSTGGPGAAMPRAVHEGAGSSTRIAYGSPDIAVSAIQQIGDEWAAARSLDLEIHAHAGLAAKNAGAVADLGRRGLLGNDVTLVQCTHLDDADLDAVAASGARIAVAPSSGMAGGLGPPPLQKFLDRKIEPGLAIGDERLAPGDMFAQMRISNSVQHAAYFDLKLAGKAGLPNLLTTRDVIRYATTAAARTAGVADVTGSLDVGKQADLIVLRTNRPNIYPINDPIGAVVWGVDTSNVDMVMVGGRLLMRDGELDADVGRARRLAESARDRVLAAAGLLAEAPAGDVP